MTLELKRPAALLEGGPRDGWAYYVDDLQELMRVADRMGHLFDYRPTDRYAVHPRAGGKVMSQVWEYSPADQPAAESLTDDDPWAEL